MNGNSVSVYLPVGFMPQRPEWQFDMNNKQTPGRIDSIDVFHDGEKTSLNSLHEGPVRGIQCRIHNGLPFRRHVVLCSYEADGSDTEELLLLKREN